MAGVDDNLVPTMLILGTGSGLTVKLETTKSSDKINREEHCEIYLFPIVENAILRKERM